MKQLFRVNSQRMMKRLEQLAEIGRTAEGGVTREALTIEDRQAQMQVAKWMEEAGLIVYHDHFGNLIGRKNGNNRQAPAVMIGSHIDTVPNGGMFDGTVGVIAGIEIAQILKEAAVTHDHPLEVVAFLDEEGTRFSGGLFGSRGMVGKVGPEELWKTDEAGVSRLEAMRSFNLEPEKCRQSVRGQGEVKVYLEMHIEQGPYLQAVNEPVGIVTGIAGPAWFTVKLRGEAGHAGTVPMSLRIDPVAGAAELIARIEQICSQEAEAATVATVGKIRAFPGGANVIAEEVQFSLDVRDTDLQRRTARIEELKVAAQAIAEKRGLQHEFICHLIQPPVECAGHVRARMQAAAKSLGFAPPLMISGAGHDAMMMKEITDIGMIFVRCQDGISHNPKEWAEIEDISKGASILLETTLHYLAYQ
ncbi:M20 family metallo-hydrolase [Alkalihalobacillus oceani]|uniref:M20 family metallo-hydrolase n=1 Tax=Halalkalibacter oceani TaxID=1653776 RepID=UPI002042142C|nr:M20 family metallo-hydrolase [Halalkalibacter oceani]MCM3760199.1 M20 family metallo-hydrolase [Halalkalibacter oceani]